MGEEVFLLDKNTNIMMTIFPARISSAIYHPLRIWRPDNASIEQHTPYAKDAATSPEN